MGHDRSTEPDISRGEPALQEAIIGEIQRFLEDAGLRYLLVQKFGLDIALWISHGSSVVTKFIELKVFSGARPGGVGFGNNRGEGPQVDILINDDQHPAFFDPSIRWIIADATRESGSPRFSIVSCEVAKKAAMAKVARGKQNNFRMAELRKHAVTWAEFREHLRQFLLG